MALCALTSIFVSCGEGSQKTEAETTVESQVTEQVEQDEAPAVVAPEGTALKVYKAPQSTQYNDAILKLSDYGEGEEGKMKFNFSAENYELGSQTPDAEDRGCANSAKGQHIHFILNNQPYKAHYTGSFEEEVPAGNSVLLAFLSRSYHESVKAAPAAIVTTISNGEGDALDINLNEDPTLFYSRPKGSYKQSAGSKILLDFYLKNCALGDGHRVRATINGEVFLLNEWAAYFVEGLGVGTHTVRLELIDENGSLVPGMFNDSGEREFTVTAD